MPKKKHRITLEIFQQSFLALIMTSHEPIKHTAIFRFFNDLNDFLPKELKNREFAYKFRGNPSVKDTIQAIGVPHTEIDVILVDGRSVGFDFILHGGEQIEIYPAYVHFQKNDIIHLRPDLPAIKKFIVDVNLGKLAPKLRLLGFDTLFENDYDDHEIVKIANRKNRIILTRDIGILKYNAVEYGYWVRNTKPFAQVAEVVKKFNLMKGTRPFTRCSVCNGDLKPVDKEKVTDSIPAKTYQMYNEFTQCNNCGKIFWKGSHVKKINEWMKNLA